MTGSLHRFVTSWRILLLCAIIYLVPFFVFSFWNHLSVDDYFIGVKKQELGFWNIQSFYYTTWSGRYVSIFCTSVLVFSNLLYSKTEWLAVYFLSATIFSSFYCLLQISRLVLKLAANGFYLFTLAVVITIAELHMIPEPVTQFYWFSGAITYQQPLVFFLLLTGTATRLFFSSRHKTLYLAVTILLLLCMHGYNEMITIWFLLYSTLIAGLYYVIINKHTRLIVGLMVCNYLFAAILLLAPGNFVRASFFDTGSPPAMLAISSVKFIVSTWFFLKEPLWWFLLGAAVLNNSVRQQLLRYPFFVYLQKIHLPKLVFIYVLLGLLTYFPVVYVSNGSVPYRMENAICFLNSLILIIILLIKSPARRFSVPGEMYKYRFVFLSLGIFLSTSLQDVAQTATSGFFYDKVMDRRRSVLVNAASQKQPVVHLEDYHSSVFKETAAYFPGGTRKTLERLIAQKPALLFFTDDLEHKENILLLQKFYGLDSIMINRRQLPVRK